MTQVGKCADSGQIAQVGETTALRFIKTPSTVGRTLGLVWTRADGQQLRAARRRAGLSQVDLGKLAGEYVDKTVRSWEQAENQPNASTQEWLRDFIAKHPPIEDARPSTPRRRRPARDPVEEADELHRAIIFEAARELRRFLPRGMALPVRLTLVPTESGPVEKSGASTDIQKSASVALTATATAATVGPMNVSVQKAPEVESEPKVQIGYRLTPSLHRRVKDGARLAEMGEAEYVRAVLHLVLPKGTDAGPEEG